VEGKSVFWNYTNSARYDLWVCKSRDCEAQLERKRYLNKEVYLCVHCENPTLDKDDYLPCLTCGLCTMDKPLKRTKPKKSKSKNMNKARKTLKYKKFIPVMRTVKM